MLPLFHEGASFRLCSVPGSVQGIRIQEHEDIIRLASPTCPSGAKGKGILHEGGDSWDSEADEGRDIPFRPCQPIGQLIAKTSSRVQRQLFPGIAT